MLGVDGEMMKKLNEVVSDKIGRVFLQLPLRQPIHQVAERRRGCEKKRNAGDRLQSAINPLDHDSNFEKEMELLFLQIQFRVEQHSSGIHARRRRGLPRTAFVVFSAKIVAAASL